MALFTSYAPPGVYTQVILQTSAAPTLGTARIPVIIGEGQQFFSHNNIEIFRGSSAVQDDQSVNENISNQITGLGRTFQTSFYPVVDGSGRGVITSNPADVQVEAIDPGGNVTPVTVISLNGATGQFSTQLIIPSGFELLITYFFKRGDTFVGTGGVTPYNVPENLLPQVPSFATQTVSIPLTTSPAVPAGSIILTLTKPGELGNNVTVQFVAGSVAPDATAVSGAGTNAITINITKPSATVTSPPTTATRTIQDLINVGIPTLDGGYLAISGSPVTPSATLLTTAAVPFAGGTGGNSNTTFKVANTPIVDGTNGGVVTTDITKIIVQVNGLTVPVLSLDGQAGMFTLVNPVPSTATSFTIQYYFNAWQHTYDLLPGTNISQ